MNSPLAPALLPDPAQTYLVGVSGGRDSMALLQWLLDGGCRQLIVCHLDHGLRPTSAADAEFVKAHARTLRLPEFIQRENITGTSIEAAAREARYQFFARAARAHGCERILLAHHADDQVETYLFNLLRGGPSAMRPIAARTIGDTSLTILRPLLGVWREDLAAYATAHRVPFCEDETNADTRFTRNKLRHHTIPALSADMGRDVRRSIWRAAERLAAEDDFIAAQPALAQPPAELQVASLRSLHIALQRRLIHAWLKSHSVADIGFAEVESVINLLTPHIAKVNLPGALCARRRAGRIFIAPQ